MFFWLFPLIPVLVVFYFLKLKRKRLEVPSLVLWRQVLNDNRVNSPFQRFKKNILLLLQLLLLALLIMAAMQPYFKGGPDQAENVPILIDHSASMAALDKSGGQSRLAAAKQRVQTMIDGLSKTQRLCLISFANTARKLTPFTNNKRVLTDALNGIEVQDVPSKVEDALRMAEALSRNTRFDRVVMLSDGNFPSQTDFGLPFQLDYQRLTPGGANLGITALNARRAGRGQWDVFVKVQSSSETPLAGTVELLRDGEKMSDEDIAVASDQAQQIGFQLEADSATNIEVRLKPDRFDSLSADNRAYLRLNPARSLWVYCPANMTTYRNALAAIEGVSLFPGSGDKTTSESEFDLLITDNPEDLKENQARVSLLIGSVPEEMGGLVELKEEGTSVIDWIRLAPILKHVELSEVLVLDDPVVAEDVDETDFEQLGYEVLVYGRRGPLLLRRTEGRKIQYRMLFHTDRSTLPYRIGFPVLVSNVVEIAMRQAGLAEVRGDRTGLLPELSVQPETDYRVIGPGKLTDDVRSDERGVLTGAAAPRVGFYQVKQGSEEKAYIGISLLDEGETELQSVETIQFNESAVSAAQQQIKIDHSLWSWLAFIALIVCIVEWWFYQRRPGGIRR